MTPLPPRAVQTTNSVLVLVDENNNVLVDDAGTAIITASGRTGDVRAYEYERLEQ